MFLWKHVQNRNHYVWTIIRFIYYIHTTYYTIFQNVFFQTTIKSYIIWIYLRTHIRNHMIIQKVSYCWNLTFSNFKNKKTNGNRTLMQQALLISISVPQVGRYLRSYRAVENVLYFGVPRASKVSMPPKTIINPTLNNLSCDFAWFTISSRSALSLFFGLGWAFLANESYFFEKFTLYCLFYSFCNPFSFELNFTLSLKTSSIKLYGNL